MNENVRNEEYGVVILFSHIDFYGRAVFFHNDTVKSQGKGYPLVLLDTAVVMGIQISKAAVFIKGILLYVHSRGIDVGA